MKQRRFLSLLCLLACLIGATPTSAVTADQQLSDAYVRQAVSILGYAQVSENDAPYVLSEILLNAALELSPDNAQAWAMRVELAKATADSDAYEAALVGYLATGIEDDRASYDLVMHRLSADNTLDGQLRQLTDLLEGQAGRSMSATLRSRLASEAASLARELFDEQARRRWAVEAARSDPANLAAAQDMLELVIELQGNTVRVGTATANVIRANPLDPQPRLQLASLLAHEAAYERAAQQYQVVATRLSQEPLHLGAYVNWAQCLAMIGQDEVALELIEQFEQALNQVPTDEQGNEPPAELEPVDLPIGLALIRLAVLDGEDEQETAQRAFEQIATRLSQEASQGDAEQAQEQADEQVDAASPLAMIAAVFCPDLDRAQEVVNAQEADPVAQGWVALRLGNLERAEELLAPHAQDNPMAACGIAMLTGVDNASRARLLQAVIQESPESMAAIAAGRTLLKLRTQAQATDNGQTLIALMSRYPEAFWLVDLERTPWLNTRLEIDPKRIEPNHPILAEITLWNTTRFPLAIGEAGPIQSQAVVVISAENAGQQIGTFPPIVVDLGRTYTLGAGERLIIDTQLDYHEFGSAVAGNPGVPFIFDVRLIVNPVVMPSGSWLPNGIGGVSEVRSCFIQDTATTEAQVATWLTQLSSDIAAQRMQAIRRLAGLHQASQPNLITPALLDRVRGPLMQAWQDGTPSEQAWMIFNAVQLEEQGTSYPELLARATQSDSDIVWFALLLRHASGPDSQILRDGVGKLDMAEVSRFAQRQRRLLRELAEASEQQGVEEEVGAE